MKISKAQTRELLLSTLQFTLFGWIIYTLKAPNISIHTPLPPELPFEYEAHGTSALFSESYFEGMTEITLSNPLNYTFLGLFTVFYLISVISILQSKKKTHPIDALPVDSIKNHVLYENFVDENEERIHLYKDDLPAEFAVWLIAHTAKSEN